MPPRTIDNLGIDASNRYAEDQKLLDKDLLQEARGIPRQTEVDVTVPYFASELELLLDLQTKVLPWAEFYAPLKYGEQKKRLFTYQVVPSLGSEDRQESQAQKILAKIKERAEKREKEKEDQQKKKPEKWEVEEEEKEKTILIALFTLLTSLDKFIIDINARRGQYQKG
jgi:hypothetical protein